MYIIINIIYFNYSDYTLKVTGIYLVYIENILHSLVKE
jgi:hypothetical protein